MDALDLLVNHGEDVELSDIEMLKIALETGPYDDAQKRKGFKLLNDIYEKLVEGTIKDSAEISVKTEIQSQVPVDKKEVLSDDKVRPAVKTRLTMMRVSSSTTTSGIKSILTSFPGKSPIEILCASADLMTGNEFNSVLSWLQLGEEVLIKYWSILDKKAVAKTQCFSEDFFILHYNDLNPNLVLKKGVNPWRNKETMSPKLAMFLKLKGVSL